MRWSDWIQSAIGSTEREVADVHPGPSAEVRAVLADLTASTNEEFEAFDRRRTVGTAAPILWEPRWALAPMMATAIAVIILWMPAEPAYAPPAMPIGTTVHLDISQSEQLGPSIRMDGLGDVQLLRAGTDGTEVALHDGVARFDVDPTGEYRDLVVHAADVDVTVKGTLFEVHTFGGLVFVRVDRGQVHVRQGDAEFLVDGGSTWSSVQAIASATLRPPSPPDVIVAAEATWISDPVSPMTVAPELPPTPTRVVRMQTPKPAPAAMAKEFNAVLDAQSAGEDPDVLYQRLTNFLVDFPGSPMDAEARALRLEVGAEVRAPDEVIRNIDLFLAMHAAFPHRLQLLELRATLARDRLHDCGLALPTYRRLAEEAAGAQAARAQAWRGLCAADQGRISEANEAFASALALDVEEPLRTNVELRQMELANPSN